MYIVIYKNSFHANHVYRYCYYKVSITFMYIYKSVNTLT